MRLGLQPHAPYSAGRALYECAARLHAERGAPLATHLAESAEERAFVANAEGPMRVFLESLGVLDEVALAEFGRGRSPVAHLCETLDAAPFLAAHCNDVSDADIELLARTNTSVAYCPRAHEYFGHDRFLGPHRYMDMLARGVNVALGTDSVINLGEDGQRITPLDDARLLYRRDSCDPTLLLRMLTTNAARALALPESLFDFTPGAVAGICAVDVAGTDPGLTPAARVMRSGERATLLTA